MKMKLAFTIIICILQNAEASTILKCKNKDIEVTIDTNETVTLKTERETCQGYVSNVSKWKRDGGKNTTIEISTSTCAIAHLKNHFIFVYHYNIQPRAKLTTDMKTEIAISDKPLKKEKCEVVFINSALMDLLKNN